MKMKVINSILKDKKNVRMAFVLMVLISLLSQYAFASGAYSAGGYPQAKSQYNQGKMLFHKQIKQKKFAACMECYKKNKNESQCEALSFCVSKDLSKSKIDALRYFLKKRYRLK